MKRIGSGEKVPKQKPGIYFDTLETMRKAITEERIRLGSEAAVDSAGWRSVKFIKW